MIRRLLIPLSGLFLGFVAGYSQVALTWSGYMGKMTLTEAGQKCASIGMRLPTLDELNAAYNSGLNKWDHNGSWTYWSTNSFGANLGDNVIMVFGDAIGYNRSGMNHVRCVRP